MTDFVPGELLPAEEPIEINAGRETATVTVENTGDRPSQVGSHFHFFECNRALSFDRRTAYGMRLDIPAGTAIRFEPGCAEEVDLVAIGGVDTSGIVGECATAVDDGRVDGHVPVVLGVVCQQAGIGCRETALVSAYASVTGLLGAAQRLGRFGHTAVQSQLAVVFPTIESVVDRYHDADLRTLGSFAPRTDIMGMAHEHADRRLFMS